MNNWWPWVVMGLGVVSLFLYRYRLFLLSKKTRIDNAKIILESSYDGVATPAPSASSPQSRLSSTANIQIESDDLKSSDLLPQSSPAPASKKASNSALPFASEQVWMPVVISLIVLLSALFVILSNNTYGDAQQKWAFGVVGTIIGYWFKK